MCGIAGVFDFSGRVVAEEVVRAMCGTIAHRGPDDENVRTGPYFGLGQRRLAIIDLDHRSAAPMANEDGTVWLTYNGELYNFRELRDELIAKGHTFRTEGDTEVIVHLYEEYGDDCVRRMRGMFALAIWDDRRQRLFAARDRLGKKPFFYARSGSALVFGSEIKAILKHPGIPVSPDLVAIDEYLTYQYVPSPRTAFEGIFKLPAAHTLVCDARGGITIERYWEPPLAEKLRAPEEEIAEELLARLDEAVRLRLISDVPLGAFLSGGIDSSAVVALMARASSSPVRTFSIGFEEQTHDELAVARLVAQRYGTDHHELVVRPDAAGVLPLLVEHFNEPFADSSALPTYYVSKMTREHVTVALSGDGGDESFAGYRNYAAVAAWSRADALPRAVRAAAGGLSGLFDRLPYTRTSARVSRGLSMVAEDLPGRFRLQTTILKPQERAAVYTASFRRAADAAARTLALEWNEEMDPLDWMMRHDQRFYLPDCLMVKTDVTSMANSLEVRCPMLDHELVEFAARIPSPMKRNAAGGKQILKLAVRGLLPEEILTKRKQGFAVPLPAWFRGPLAPLLRESLLDDRARSRGLFDHSAMARLIDDHVAGRRDYASRLWAFLFLELWFRRWID